MKYEAKPGDEVEAGGQEPHPNSLLQLCKKEKVVFLFCKKAPNQFDEMKKPGVKIEEENGKFPLK